MVNLETAPPAVETIEQETTPESIKLQAGPQPEPGNQNTSSDPSPSPGQ